MINIQKLYTLLNRLLNKPGTRLITVIMYNASRRCPSGNVSMKREGDFWRI